MTSAVSAMLAPSSQKMVNEQTEFCSSNKPQDYFYGFERSKIFEQLYFRLQYLERWKELAIRPCSVDDCDPEDLDLFHDELDDIMELQKRCNRVRVKMNLELPPIEIIPVWDDFLVARESSIEGAGLGLYYEPTVQKIIPKGTTICFYTGQLHMVQSSRELVTDKSYLMMVAGNNLVDPGPCLAIKARYINDPLNETAINCEYVPNGAWRSAVVTTRDVHPGEELFVSYGELYWSQQEVPGRHYRDDKFEEPGKDFLL